MSPIDTRTLTPSEKLSNLLKVGMLRRPLTGVISSTVASAALAKGGTSVTLASGTGFVIGQYAVIGSFNTMEIVQVANVAGAVLTLFNALHHPHPLGEAVVVLEDLNLGEISADGVEDSFNVGTQLVTVGTRIGPWDSGPGHTQQVVRFKSLAATLDNLALLLGINPNTNDSGGAGSLASKWFLDRDPERLFRSLTDAAIETGAIGGRFPCVYFEGEYLADAKKLRMEYWSCLPAEGEKGFKVVAAGDPAMVDFAFNWFSNSRIYRWAP